MVDLGELTLQPAGVLELNLGTADPNPLPPVDIQLLDERDNPVRLREGLCETVRRELGSIQEIPPFLALEMPVSLPAGRLAFAVPAGAWRLRAESKEHPLLESDPVEVRQGEWTRVFLEFVPAGEIKGVCVGLDGAPISGVKVYAMPVRYKDDPEDYTIVPENQIPGKNGISITRKIRSVTDHGGIFRFFPIPSDSAYELWCGDQGYSEVEMKAQSKIERHIVPVGVKDLCFVLRENPQLYLRVEDAHGEEPGPGPGYAYLHADYIRSGIRDGFSLEHNECFLPIPQSIVTFPRKRLCLLRLCLAHRALF